MFIPNKDELFHFPPKKKRCITEIHLKEGLFPVALTQPD